MLDVHDDAGALLGGDVGDAAKKELAVSTGELVDDVKSANSGACWSSDTTDLDSVLSC